MKATLRQHIFEISCFLLLSFGLVAIAHAQNTSDESEPQKRVRVEVEITENGKTSTSIQELNLDRESINGQLDEMVEEIEMILEEAVQDVKETDLEITIRRNHFGDMNVHSQDPHYRTYLSIIPESPTNWSVEDQSKAFLGVYATSMDEDELESKELAQGVEIERVVEGSAADMAGLRVGDYVYEIGGEPIGSFGDLSKTIKSHQPGEEVDIKLLRGSEQLVLSASLGTNSAKRYEWKEDTRAFLGVRGRDDKGGALIETLIDGTAAYRSDLKTADVIVNVDGVEISSFEELGAVIRAKEAGEIAQIVVIRDNERQSIEVELGSRSEGYNVTWNNFDYEYDYSLDDEESDNKAFLGIVGKTSDDGVEITRVIEGTTADEIDLESGDVIYSLDGKKISDISDLVDHLSGLKEGDDLKIAYKRDGKKMKQTAKLGSKSHCSEIIDGGSNGIEVRKIIMHIEVEELEAAEIEELSNKSGQNLDPSNSLELNTLEFSPNPNNGQFKLMFDLPEEGDTEIRVFDQNGRTIEVQELKSFKGLYSNQFDISEAPSGVYFVSITQNGKGMTAKVVKQ